jgi:hypothetical protein
VLETKALAIPDTTAWEGRTVELSFEFFGKPPSGTAPGWLLDDVRVTGFAP